VSELIDREALRAAMEKVMGSYARTISIGTTMGVINAAPEVVCETCRFWEMGFHMFEGVRRCGVRGSFRGDLWTDGDFGCVHWSARR